jgi:hypothetical protein
MATTFTQCPKCGHIRQPNETAAPEQCPACGIYFAKWAEREKFVPPSLRNTIAEEEDEEMPRWRDQILDRVFHVPKEITSVEIWGRAAILVFLLVWGIRMARMDYRDGEMGQSFMHNILLPIHEAGHIIFMPFGEFMTILGGSLFQILFPLIIAAAILWQNRDACGAAIGLWWASVSLIDLAPYIYDARYPKLMLITGQTGEDGPHDWIYLLGRFHRVERSQVYGALVHHVGVVFMILSLAAAAAVLWRWRKARDEIESDTMLP